MGKICRQAYNVEEAPVLPSPTEAKGLGFRVGGSKGCDAGCCKGVKLARGAFPSQKQRGASKAIAPPVAQRVMQLKPSTWQAELGVSTRQAHHHSRHRAPQGQWELLRTSAEVYWGSLRWGARVETEA